MLVPFVIDADSLAPDPAWPLHQTKRCHLSLLDVWSQIGLLGHDSSEFEQSKLNKAIEGLPPAIRSLWLGMLKHAPLRPCSNGWDGVVSVSSVTQLVGDAAVALVDDAKAEVDFEISDDEFSKTMAGGDIEICRLESSLQAPSFQRALVFSGKHIEAGETFQNVWDQRFKTLSLAPIKLISIVDRYAISQHFNCDQTRLSGLERFLRLLDSNSDCDRHVTIYSAWTADLGGKNINDIELELGSVLSKLPLGKIRRIKIVMIKNTTFSDVGHDRFIRFGRCVWDIGLGVKVFEGAYAAERSSATFKTGSVVDGYIKAETLLSQAAEPRNIIQMKR